MRAVAINPGSIQSDAEFCHTFQFDMHTHIHNNREQARDLHGYLVCSSLSYMTFPLLYKNI